MKPGNAVVRQGRAVLLDLGSLTPLGRVYGRHDAPGTTAYMSPELLDDGVVSPAGDVFALGVTLSELLEKAPALPVVDDLLDRMTSPQPADRPDGRRGARRAARRAGVRRFVPVACWADPARQ